MPRPPPTAMTDGVPPLRVPLTGRDLEALHHLAAGRSTASVAAAMSVSTNTARGRIHRLQNKLGAPARDQVVPRASTLGLLREWDGPARSGGTIAAPPEADHDSDRAGSA